MRLVTAICLINIFLLNSAAVRANPIECAEQTATAAFLEESGLLCLQKIAIQELPEIEFYKASLQWSGPDKPDEFRLLSVEGDLAAGEGSPVFDDRERYVDTIQNRYSQSFWHRTLCRPSCAGGSG